MDFVHRTGIKLEIRAHARTSTRDCRRVYQHPLIQVPPVRLHDPGSTVPMNIATSPLGWNHPAPLTIQRRLSRIDSKYPHLWHCLLLFWKILFHH